MEDSFKYYKVSYQNMNSSPVFLCSPKKINGLYVATIQYFTSKKDAEDFVVKECKTNVFQIVEDMDCGTMKFITVQWK